MQEELLQFQIQKVWILVDLIFGKKVIRTKWVYNNKKDEKGVVVRNKERLVTQGHRQDEGIDYDEVFAPVARIEAIRIFLDFASYMGFIVYQIDVKSAFLYGTINEEVYVSQPPGFVDLKFPNKKSWCDEFEELMKNSVKTASTPIKTQKPFVKDEEAADVDVHLYRYLKGQTKLGLWYPKVSSFDLEAYFENDYAGANLDRKSTTGVFHSKTKHIKIRHQFLRDAYEKKIIQVLKIHTDDKVADLLTKDFDVSSTGRQQLSTARHKVSTASSEDQPTLTESSSEHDFSQDPRVDLKGTGRSGGDHVHLPYDSPLSGGHTSDRAEGSLYIEALSALCTSLSNRVLALETGRKHAKSGPTKDDSDKFDVELDEDMEYMDTEEALNEGRQSTDDTARLDVSTLIKLNDDKAKGVAFKNSESTDRPARSILTLKPFQTIDPKDKRKGVLEETDSAKKMTKSDFDAAQIARDEEIARQLEVELQAELERERQREEQTSIDYIANLYDEVQARIDADEKLAVKWTHEEHKKYTVDERANDKFDVELDEDMEYMDTEEALNEGRQSIDDTARLDSTDRPARSILTLKPFQTIDPKDKRKGVLEETDSAKKMTKSDFDATQIARDEEIARQLEVELQAELERERQRYEQTSIDYIANLYDEVQARIDADEKLAVKWTHEEHEKYTVDERAKLLAEYFERRIKQLAQERATAIRNKPPTKT
nr:copia protein [Tanacetum cinerariifolium]